MGRRSPLTAFTRALAAPMVVVLAAACGIDASLTSGDGDDGGGQDAISTGDGAHAATEGGGMEGGGDDSTTTKDVSTQDGPNASDATEGGGSSDAYEASVPDVYEATVPDVHEASALDVYEAGGPDVHDAEAGGPTCDGGSASCNGVCCPGFRPACQNNQCCATPGAGGCQGNNDCCSPFVCNAANACASSCATSGSCANAGSCCMGFFCSSGGSAQCTACYPNGATCTQDFECCGGRCKPTDAGQVCTFGGG